MLLIAALLMLGLAQATAVVTPSYPAHAVSGGTVVAVLQVSAGAVRSVDIRQGDDPFVEPVRAALGGWRFHDPAGGKVLVVVSFRSPYLSPIGSGSRGLGAVRTTPGLAAPTNVVEPAYPPNSLGEGSVVLRLTINEGGSVSKVRVVQGLGVLTDACVAAARQWKFNPARTGKGTVAPSEAYAVCVIRRPVL
jgi:TonB family protein